MRNESTPSVDSRQSEYLRSRADRLARPFSRLFALAMVSVAFASAPNAVASKGVHEDKAGNAAKAAKKCAPGHFSLGIVGSHTSANPNASFTLDAKECSSSAKESLKGVKLEEIGPGYVRYAWKVNKIHEGQAKKEQFEVNFDPWDPATDTLTLEAISRQKKILGKDQVKVRYKPTQSSATTLTPEGSISLISGPTTDVELDTDYTYEIEVESNESFNDAHFMLVVPPSNDQQQVEDINLVANQPWTQSFNIDFLSACYMSKSALTVTVSGSTSEDNGPPSDIFLTEFFTVTPAPDDPFCAY